MASPTAAVDVQELVVEFRTVRGWVRAVDGISFRIEPGRTLVLLGESGSGKSATARALLGVLPRRHSRVDGKVELAGRDLLRMNADERRATRGPTLAMVFQDALAALNPVLKVGYQVTEGCRTHQGLTRKQAGRHAVELLQRVGIPDAARRADDFPHQFSGGMRQRVTIAMALACNPQVLIADEPTTALDVTIQAQILDLLGDIQAERGMSLLLITHDMGVVAGMADDMVVMYAGRLAEHGPADDVYDHPSHPYTKALLDSIPRPEQKGRALPVIAGQPPDIRQLPSGCAFRTRCPEAADLCVRTPPTVMVRPGQFSACHFARPAEAEARS